MSSVLKKRRRRKDYQNKSFNNPFFKDKRHKKGRLKVSKKSILYTIIILLILSFTFWFFYISSTFKIKDIEVNGLERIAKEDVLNKVLETSDKTKFFLSQNNLFLINTNDIISDLNEEFNFASIDIDKELSGKLIIEISERKYEAIFLEDGNYYYIDSKGYIIDKINKLEAVNPRKYAIINNESNEEIKDNKIGIQTDYIVFIDSFWTELKQRSSDIIIERFIVKNRNSGLSVQIIDGPILYLNIKGEAKSQARNLVVLKDNELKDDFFNRSYIDLRYGDRLFLD